MDRTLWQLILLTRNMQKPDRITCEECFALLEFDALRLKAGDAIENIRPTVRHQLSLCPGCQAKLDGWMEELNAQTEATGNGDSHKE